MELDPPAIFWGNSPHYDVLPTGMGDRTFSMGTVWPMAYQMTCTEGLGFNYELKP